MGGNNSKQEVQQRPVPRVLYRQEHIRGLTFVGWEIDKPNRIALMSRFPCEIDVFDKKIRSLKVDPNFIFKKFAVGQKRGGKDVYSHDAINYSIFQRLGFCERPIKGCEFAVEENFALALNDFEVERLERVKGFGFRECMEGFKFDNENKQICFRYSRTLVIFECKTGRLIKDKAIESDRHIKQFEWHPKTNSIAFMSDFSDEKSRFSIVSFDPEFKRTDYFVTRNEEFSWNPTNPSKVIFQSSCTTALFDIESEKKERVFVSSKKATWNCNGTLIVMVGFDEKIQKFWGVFDENLNLVSKIFYQGGLASWNPKNPDILAIVSKFSHVNTYNALSGRFLTPNISMKDPITALTWNESKPHLAILHTFSGLNVVDFSCYNPHLKTVLLAHKFQALNFFHKSRFPLDLIKSIFLFLDPFIFY